MSPRLYFTGTRSADPPIMPTPSQSNHPPSDTIIPRRHGRAQPSAPPVLERPGGSNPRASGVSEAAEWPVPAREQLLTAEELALRSQVPKSHVYRLTRDGRIPAVRLGRYYRYRLAAIEAWEQDNEAFAAA